MNKINKVFVILSFTLATAVSDYGSFKLINSGIELMAADYSLIILCLIINAVFVAILTNWNTPTNTISGNHAGGDLVAGNKTSVIK